VPLVHNVQTQIAAMIPNAGAVMTPMRHSLDEQARVGVAIELMNRCSAELLPVTRDGRVIGVISGRDLHAAVVHNAHRLRLCELCPAPAYVAALDEPLDDVLMEMANRDLASAVVVDARGRVVGVLTAANVCHLCQMCLRGKTPERVAWAIGAG
jgi:CBS domain-containing protein